MVVYYYSMSLTWEITCRFGFHDWYSETPTSFAIGCAVTYLLAFFVMGMPKMKTALERILFQKENTSSFESSTYHSISEEDKSDEMRLTSREIIAKKRVIPAIYAIIYACLHVAIMLVMMSMNGYDTRTASLHFQIRRASPRLKKVVLEAVIDKNDRSLIYSYSDIIFLLDDDEPYLLGLSLQLHLFWVMDTLLSWFTQRLSTFVVACIFSCVLAFLSSAIESIKQLILSQFFDSEGSNCDTNEYELVCHKEEEFRAAKEHQIQHISRKQPKKTQIISAYKIIKLIDSVISAALHIAINLLLMQLNGFVIIAIIIGYLSAYYIFQETPMPIKPSTQVPINAVQS